MSIRKSTKKVLEIGQTTGTPFYVRGRFQLKFKKVGTTGAGKMWHLEILDRQDPPTSDNWSIMTTQPFTDDTPGRETLTIDGSPGFQYRVRNTAATPDANTETECSFAEVTTQVWR